MPLTPVTGPTAQAAVAVDAANTPVPRQKPKSQQVAANRPPAPSEMKAATEKPRSDPRTLVGLSEQATRHLLGEPTWTEEVPPARYWQYATPSCVLRVFFFMEMNTRNYRVLSYELTSTDDAPDVDEQCFADFLSKATAGRQAAYNDGN